MIAIGAGTSIASAIYGHHQGRKAAKAEQAAYRQQAHFTMLQADAMLGAARAQAAAAGYSVRAGKANAKFERALAARVQPVEDLDLQQANARRREKIGEGRAAFAANGILVDSGAAAKWERDEIADAAIEKLQIMQAAEDQIQGHLWNAAMRLSEGYAQAGAAYSGAAQTASSAYATALQAIGALQQAGAVQKPSTLALGLNIAGAALGAAGKIYGANAGSGGASPASGGVPAPSVSDIYWRTPSAQRASGGMQIA